MSPILSSFSVFRSLFLRPPVYSSDNLVFKLHYRVSAGLLLVCSALTCSVQMFGVPIMCIVQGVPEKIFNTYCWIHSTFTLPYRAKVNEHEAQEFSLKQFSRLNHERLEVFVSRAP